MLGYEDHELPDNFSVWEDTTAPEDVLKSRKLQQKLISKQIDRVVVEFKMKHKEGHWVDVLSRAAAIFNDRGKAIRIVGTHTDVTAIRKAEQALILEKVHAEESDRLKSAFLANISHEIRTPMNGILGFASLLKESGFAGPEQQQYIDYIQQCGARLLGIIDEIVEISKIEAGSMETEIKQTNIHELAEGLSSFFKPVAEAKGLQFSCKNTLTAKEAFIRTDRKKVRAILANIIKNAIKFTNEGSIELCCRNQANNLEFSVKDTGRGIRREQLDIIFLPFRQGDDLTSSFIDGPGLGLAIAKAYAQMLGGTIRAESEEGKGSTFYFTIPFHPAQAVKNAGKHIASH